ncbi:hypothetical protein HanRHA438_Chr02g0050451 [Helianthus annuus]|uniref:Uncharacterized protein n=1 Tax=Helianthus annuus TaxID=4232 RepID=A0A9K3JLI4_HELAN|nr:hypothetical protein HanXRQr2_Chr02g0049371 [Helianthus annuus]KAJ0613768.1 hypothetical protein HanIR_Chr02g0055031 [Helianthus annuus]KAJ0617557.1 hypothetical protein HanHA89_Chr02g0043151 [Helianthus annuus]KAJ0938495.1 hypothetical protein HanRHA438_Chr02g0050451 [Helianthus annuus]KAJ0950481.1 hypothetical protein HanPSC8_Chr02g0048751 [Helianthus annuus]
MCDRRKVDAEIVQIESNDVIEAIKHEIVKNNVSKLVIGASSKGIFSRGRICHRKSRKAFRAYVLFMLFRKGYYLHSGLLIWKPLDPVKMITIVVIQLLSQILQVLQHALEQVAIDFYGQRD